MDFANKYCFEKSAAEYCFEKFVAELRFGQLLERTEMPKAFVVEAESGAELETSCILVANKQGLYESPTGIAAVLSLLRH